MLVHTVLIKLLPGSALSELDDLSFRLRQLADAVAGPTSCVVGPNVSDEGLGQGYDFGFVIRFEDRAALNSYHVNPAHLAVSLAIRGLAETVLVFDVEEEDQPARRT
jgi:hypothetical protein